MLKTLTFGAVHMTVAFSVANLMTGSFVIGDAIALIEPAVERVTHFVHETVWEHACSGRRFDSVPHLMA